MNCQLRNSLAFLVFGASLGVVMSIQPKSYAVAHEYRLYKYLFTNYNSQLRPVLNASHAVQVEMGFSLLQLTELNDKKQELYTTGYITVSWTDQFLCWNKSDFGGIEQMIIPPNQVWLPEIGLANSAVSIYDASFRTEYRVTITNEGLTYWQPGGKFVTSCSLDITYYPFDHQRCVIDFTNWVYPGTLANLSTSYKEVNLVDYTISGEWHIAKTDCKRGERFYGGLPYPNVKCALYLERKYAYHMVNIMAPCAMMSCLILLVFWVPPPAGEKISLGITVLLSFSVFLLMITENLPKTSDSMPIVGFYLMFCMILSCISVLITVVVLNLIHKEADQPVPRWVRRYVMRGMGSVINFKLKRYVNLQDVHRLGLSGNEEISPIMKTTCSNSQTRAIATLTSPMERKIFDSIDKMLEKHDEMDKEEQVANEWRIVATIVDRFCFYVFIVLLSTFSLVMLVGIPMAQNSKKKV